MKAYIAEPIYYSKAVKCVFGKNNIKHISQNETNILEKSVQEISTKITSSIFAHNYKKNSIESCWKPTITDEIRIATAKYLQYTNNHKLENSYLVPPLGSSIHILATLVSNYSRIWIHRKLEFGIYGTALIALVDSCRYLARKNRIFYKALSFAWRKPVNTKFFRARQSFKNDMARKRLSRQMEKHSWVYVSVLPGNNTLSFEASSPIVCRLLSNKRTKIYVNEASRNLLVNDMLVSKNRLNKLDERYVILNDTQQNELFLGTLKSVIKLRRAIGKIDQPLALKQILKFRLLNLVVEMYKSEKEIIYNINALRDQIPKGGLRALLVPDSNPVNRRIGVLLNQDKVETCSIDTCIIGAVDDDTGKVFTDRVFISGAWNYSIYAKKAHVDSNKLQIVGSTKLESVPYTSGENYSGKVIFLTENLGLKKAMHTIKYLRRLPKKHSIEIWAHPSEEQQLFQFLEVYLDKSVDNIKLVPKSNRCNQSVVGAVSIVEYSTIGIDMIRKGSLLISTSKLPKETNPYYSTRKGTPTCLDDLEAFLDSLESNQALYLNLCKYQQSVTRTYFDNFGKEKPSKIISNWLTEKQIDE